ncbi:MAG: hypothetical protein KBT33_05375 [Prevotellaceae bacterium]|nr:hypothetical protein [Candidatus Minthosoma equi]
MKKINDMKWGFMLVALLAILSFGAASCSDNDSAGQPEITGVRVCDPEKADSLFDKSSQGQVIAIIGKNLGNAKKLTINGQNVYFSPTMNTDHSIICTIPSEDEGFDIRTVTDKTIVVETPGGIATYNFTILGQYPSITRIQGDYPRMAGDTLKVYGLNLYAIEDIYFTDVVKSELDTLVYEDVPGNRVQVKDYTVEGKRFLDNSTYKVNSTISIVTPSLPFDAGTLVIECTAGRVLFPYTKLAGIPVIKTISSDMPVIGEDLVITGNEFVQVESITFGDVTYGAKEFVVAESEDTITVTITKIPSAGSGSTLVLKTVGGEAKVEHFYDYSTLLVNFDDYAATNNGWSPDALYETANSEAAPYMSSGTYAHIAVDEVGPMWWGTMIFYRYNWEDNIFPFPGNDVIPDNAKAKDIYLAMEVFDNNSEYNGGVFTGYLRYCMFPIGADTGASDLSMWTFDNMTDWEDYDAGIPSWAHTILGDIDGNNPKGKWYRHVLSLENFGCYAGLTYADIKSVGLSQFRIQSINQGSKPGRVDVCVDNIRLIYLPKK